jgi:hypothetical protein
MRCNAGGLAQGSQSLEPFSSLGMKNTHNDIQGQRKKIVYNTVTRGLDGCGIDRNGRERETAGQNSARNPNDSKWVDCLRKTEDEIDKKPRRMPYPLFAVTQKHRAGK